MVSTINPGAGIDRLALWETLLAMPVVDPEEEILMECFPSGICTAECRKTGVSDPLELMIQNNGHIEKLVA